MSTLPPPSVLFSEDGWTGLDGADVAGGFFCFSEDVQNFEKSVVSAGSRARAKNSKSIGGEAAEEVEEEEEEIVGKPRRSKVRGCQ